MRQRTIALTVILLMTAFAFANAEEAESITFAAAPVAAGDTWQDASAYGTDVTLALHDSYRELPPVTQSASIEREKQVKVTSVTGNDRITGIEVEYLSVAINGTDVSATYAGKKYSVAVSGNKASTVTYTDGSTPPADEVAFVASDNNHLGQMREMNRTFGGATVAVGQELRARNPEELVDAEAGMSVRDFSMTLSSIDGDTATFDVVLSLANDVKKGRGAAGDAPGPFDTSSMTMDLTGTLQANVSNSRITSISLSGPATVSGRKGTNGKKGSGASQQERFQSLSGGGTAGMTSSYTYP